MNYNHEVLQEVQKYRKLKADIRNQAKAKVKQITKEQRDELLKEGRKEGKEYFLQKIANTSGMQGANAIQNMKPLRPRSIKTIKIGFKLVFAECGINFRI